jgi:hypothetical protein
MGNAPITWQSKRQPTVSRSNIESEYRALSDGTQEAVWIRRLTNDLGLDAKSITLNTADSKIISNLKPTKMYCDNQGAIKLAKNPIFHARTKHIEIHHHFIREKVQDKQVTLQYISTHDQPADILTKPLSRPKFQQHCLSLGIVPIHKD